MKASKRALDLIKECEGVKLTAYRCPAGVWTIGYGRTVGVSQGMKISAIEAENFLRQDVRKFEAAINKLVKVDLKQSQFDALVSFVYNIGEGNFAKSTMLKLINNGQLDKVPNEFSKWIYAGKKKLNGLIARRAKEAALWVDDEWMADAEPATAHDARRAVPAIINKENLSFGAGIVGSVATAASEITADAPPVQYALAGIMAIGFCAGLWFFIRRRGA